jgi:hypothetical protein
VIWVVGRKNCLIRNHYSDTRIGEYANATTGSRILGVAWRLFLLRRALLLLASLGLRTGQRFAVELIDRFAHHAECIPQLQLLLTLNRNPHQRHNSERQDGEHRHRDYQLNQRKAARSVRQT